MQNVTINLNNVDWTLPRERKETLLDAIGTVDRNAQAEHLQGLVHLLDNIQDQASEVLGEDRVFGKTQN